MNYFNSLDKYTLNNIIELISINSYYINKIINPNLDSIVKIDNSTGIERMKLIIGYKYNDLLLDEYKNVSEEDYFDLLLHSIYSYNLEGVKLFINENTLINCIVCICIPFNFIDAIKYINSKYTYNKENIKMIIELHKSNHLLELF